MTDDLTIQGAKDANGRVYRLVGELRDKVNQLENQNRELNRRLSNREEYFESKIKDIIERSINTVVHELRNL